MRAIHRDRRSGNSAVTRVRWRAPHLLLLLTSLLGACGGDSRPLNAVGSYSDVAILTDLQMFSGVALELERALEAEIHYGLRPEKMLDVQVYDLREKRKAALTKNIIVIGFLKGRDAASKEIRRRLAGAEMKVVDHRGLFLATRQDVYAGNQNVLFLAGNDRNVMQAAVRDQAPALRGQIEARNRERVREYLFSRGRDAEAERRLVEQGGFRLAVPADYRIRAFQVNREGTLGAVEVLADRPTRSVTVFWKQLEDPTAVDLEDTDRLLALRRQWGLFLDERLQDGFGYEWSKIVFLGEERPMLSGMYETGDESYGGPFRTVFLVDPVSRRLYGVNWLCFRPGNDKHSLMREVRALAETFSPRP